MQASAGSPQTQTDALKLAEHGGEIWKHGDYDEALTLLAEAQQLAEAAGDEFALATAFYHLGEMAYIKAFFMQDGDVSQAMDFHQQSLALREEIDDQPGTAISLSRIGVLHERDQEDDRAMACYKRAISISDEIDFPQGMIRPYTHIGGYHRRNGNLPAALDYYQKALTISEEIKDQENVVFGLCNVGWFAYRQDGEKEKALARFNRALGIAKRLDFKFAIGRVYHVLAELFWNEGDSDQALAYFEKLSQLAHGVNYKMLSDQADRRIAEIKE